MFSSIGADDLIFRAATGENMRREQGSHTTVHANWYLGRREYFRVFHRADRVFSAEVYLGRGALSREEGIIQSSAEVYPWRDFPAPGQAALSDPINVLEIGVNILIQSNIARLRGCFRQKSLFPTMLWVHGESTGCMYIHCLIRIRAIHQAVTRGATRSIVHCNCSTSAASD